MVLGSRRPRAKLPAGCFVESGRVGAKNMRVAHGADSRRTESLPKGHLLHEFVSRAAERRPEQPFLIQEEEERSYGDVEAASNRVAQILIREGLKVGDRVALLSENSLFYVEAYYGILKAGGIVVALNTAWDGSALASVLRSCSARFLLASSRFAKVALKAASFETRLEAVFLAGAAAGVDDLPQPVRGILFDEVIESVSSESVHVSLSDADVASIVYTSGSTGVPQGATLSHANLCANVASITEYLALSSEDRVLAVLPFYYVYGKSILNTHAAVGGTVVIENRFQYPNIALDTLENKGCTGFSGVPSTFAILLNRSNFTERALPHLRYVTQAGGGMSPQLTQRLIEALPEKKIFVMYGATEASARLAYLPPEALSRKLGSIGKAIPGVELRVQRSDGSDVELGEVGEIIARGPNIMLRYWDDPVSTAAVLDERGYHTGDLARYDEEGFLFLEGRSKDFIKAGAHRISAREIEDAISATGEIHECAVIGAPDELLGERIIACVVPMIPKNFDPVGFKKGLKRHLPTYKIPREVFVLEELPKNESGKIMKKVLKASYSSSD